MLFRSLTSISLEKTELTRDFSEDIKDGNYFATVENNVTKDKLTAVVGDVGASVVTKLYKLENDRKTWTLQNNINSGIPTEITFDVGDNVYLIKALVNADAGEKPTIKKYYSLTINRKVEEKTDFVVGDPLLKSITTNVASISPLFDSNITSYNLSVTNKVEELALTIEAKDDKAVISVRSEAWD